MVKSTKTPLLLAAGFILALGVTGPLMRGEVFRRGYRFNSTASMPVGIYKIVAGGNLVSFCPPEPYATLSMERNYRERAVDSVCPDQGVPFLKQIVAVAGDEVSLSAAGVSVNGRRLRNSAPLRIDSHNRTLPGYPFGVYVTQPGQVWVINEYSAKSLDSRYYGPVQVSEIREHLKPVAVMP